MEMKVVYRGLMLFLMLLIMAGCGSNGEVKNDVVVEEVKPQAEPEIITTETGLRYADLVVGEGVEAANGMPVEVHYALWLDDNGQKGQLIQNSKDQGALFPFTVGMPGLIAGWNQGMIGMKPGGIRRLYIPSDLGYGPNGRPPLIPGNANLIFEIELVNIK